MVTCSYRSFCRPQRKKNPISSQVRVRPNTGDHSGKKHSIPGNNGDLFTGPSADHSTEANVLPETVPSLQELWKLCHPSFTQCPREDFILFFFLVLFHVIGQIPKSVRREGVSEWVEGGGEGIQWVGYHKGVSKCSNTQSNEEVCPVVGIQRESSSSEVNIHHSQQILEQKQNKTWSNLDCQLILEILSI